MNRQFLIAGVILIAAGALSSGCDPDPKDEPQLEYEFVCESDGELTERHVGVAEAWLTRSGSFTIRYTDGEANQYFPEPGESCHLEHVR